MAVFTFNGYPVRCRAAIERSNGDLVREMAQQFLSCPVEEHRSSKNMESSGFGPLRSGISWWSGLGRDSGKSFGTE